MMDNKPHDSAKDGYEASSSFLLDIAPLVLAAMILMVQFSYSKTSSSHSFGLRHLNHRLIYEAARS